MCDDVDDVAALAPLSCNEKNSVVSRPEKTEKNRETEKCYQKKEVF